MALMSKLLSNHYLVKLFLYMKILLHWLILTVGIMITAYFVPGIQVSGIIAALIAGAVLGLINFIIKPILRILTLPINILTLGLFSIVLNGLLFYLLSLIVSGVTISSFTAAVIGSVVVSLINWIGVKLLRLD